MTSAVRSSILIAKSGKSNYMLFYKVAKEDSMPNHTCACNRIIPEML